MRWVHTFAMLADGLTKATKEALCALQTMISKGRWRFVYDEHFISGRKKTY